MANLSVPNNYTFSPSSATHLTINHDVAAELDSTYAFEGTCFHQHPLTYFLISKSLLTDKYT